MKRYALVIRGGHVPGQRPRTKLAEVISPIRKHGRLLGYSAHISTANGWTKHPQFVEAKDIVEGWERHPTPEQIAAARSRLETATK